LNNGQQIVLALDEGDQIWVTYDEHELVGANVVAWKELESREEIEKQLSK
jgi:selenocysteine lyase/cysteine desulfurase